MTIPVNPSNEPEIEILSSAPEKFDACGSPTSDQAPSPEANLSEVPPVDSDWKAIAEETKEKMIWLAAEFDNYKKRVLKDRDEERKFSQSTLLKEFLGVADNLERALAAMPSGEETTSQGFAAMRQGVELTLKYLKGILAKQGVTRMQVVGEKFDPRFHEVMLEEKTDKAPDEAILEEFQAGYLHQDRVLRSAMVKVAKNTKAN